MGGRRIPRKKTVTRFVCAGLAAFAIAGCQGSAHSSVAEVSPTPAPSPTPLAAPPSPTPAPDPLGPPPANAAEARNGLQLLLGPTAFAEPCPPALVSKWKVACATGDVDGDGLPDTAWVVPLHPPAPRSPAPAVVLLRTAASQEIEEFAQDGSADTSPAGISLFGLADRDGHPGAELAYVITRCAATICTATARIQAWDGAAWRDIGPGDDGLPALASATFDGAGAASELILTGGILDPAAGPTRLTTRAYAFSDGRYRLVRTDHGPSEYLYHAVLDADALFAAGKFELSIAAYTALINHAQLKDWKKEAGHGDGRPALEGYARFRIAVATAALGLDPTEAIDAAIRDGKEQVFSIAAQEFRKGFQEHRTVIAGCASATRYLGTTGNGADNPAYIARLFDYGYANQPARTYQDICRLP